MKAFQYYVSLLFFFVLYLLLSIAYCYQKFKTLLVVKENDQRKKLKSTRMIEKKSISHISEYAYQKQFSSSEHKILISLEMKFMIHLFSFFNKMTSLNLELFLTMAINVKKKIVTNYLRNFKLKLILGDFMIVMAHSCFLFY